MIKKVEEFLICNGRLVDTITFSLFNL